MAKPSLTTLTLPSTSRPVEQIVRLPFSIEVEAVYPPLSKTDVDGLWSGLLRDGVDDQSMLSYQADVVDERLRVLEARIAKLESNSASQEQPDKRLSASEEHIASIADTMRRLAERFAPGPPAEIVDSRYVADALDCSTQWIGQQVRTGSIPKSCIVAGTGNGKPWKFHKQAIDKWLKSR